MALDPLTAILNISGTIIDRLIPDKTQAAQAKAELLSMQLKGEIDAQIAQAQIDTAEASNQNVFVAGWRPFVGWACGAAFIYAFIVQPTAQAIAVFRHSSFDVSKLPQLNLDQMLPVLLGMLGLGAMRSFDKTNGSSNGH